MTVSVFAGADVKAAAKKEGGQKFSKEIVAVLDLKATGTSSTLALAASIRLREELLKSGFFNLVDRQQLNRVLDEQALSQASCLGANCNIKVGQITGARIIMTGDLVQLSEDSWQVSALMTDVETAEVLRAESILVEGNAADLLDEGVHQLVGKLVPKGDPGAYGGVVNFLLQTSADLVTGAAAGLLGVEQDEESGQVKLKANNQFRLLVSPLSFFRYGIRNTDYHHLEHIKGRGVSLGLEREIDKAWGVGVSMHLGAVEKRSVSSEPTHLVLGYYSAWSLYVLDAVPNGHPWFYYGTGIFNYSLNYADRGENLMAEGTGVLFIGRFMHTLLSGAVVGVGAESNYVYSLQTKSTRIEQYEAAGEDVSPHAWGGLMYLFVGYTF